MSSTKSAVFFIALIFIQLNGSFAYCNENYNNCQKQRKGVWNSVKEIVSEASENGILAFGVKTAAVATAAIVAAPVVVGAAGFGAAGIVGGSVAATVQATWFGGVISGLTGTAFAGLQSAGAAGLGIAAKSAIVTASGAAVKAYEYFLETPKENENEYCKGKSADNNNKLC